MTNNRTTVEIDGDRATVTIPVPTEVALLIELYGSEKIEALLDNEFRKALDERLRRRLQESGVDYLDGVGHNSPGGLLGTYEETEE